MNGEAVNEGAVNEGGAASVSGVPPPLPQPPPPPAGWRWPREGDRVEIEVEEEGATLWRPATVVSVISSGPETGWFSARMLHDNEWVDWFTWQEEGKDWRRTGGKRKLSATASEAAADGAVVGDAARQTAAAPSGKNPNASASQDEPPPPLLPQPPPPPAGWRWPREGDRVEIEVEEEGATLWRPATVVSVISSGPETGWFSARMLHDNEWVDWFTWQEEGKDWRRTGGKRKLSATASETAEAAEAAEAEAAAEEAASDRKATKKAVAKKTVTEGSPNKEGSLAKKTVTEAAAEAEVDKAAKAAKARARAAERREHFDDCGQCVNCLDKPKFGGPNVRRHACSAPQPKFGGPNACMHAGSAPCSAPKGSSPKKEGSPNKEGSLAKPSPIAKRGELKAAAKGRLRPEASDEDFESFPAPRGKNPNASASNASASNASASLASASNASASQDEPPPPPLPPPLPLPPPPPAGWRWPREGDRVEIEVEEEGATLWRPATVVSVISSGPETGWFSARMLHDNEWVDWFTWQEEGKDWRRTGGKRKLSATASKLAVPAEAAEAAREAGEAPCRALACEAAEAAEAEAAVEEAGADQTATKKAAVKKAGAVAGAIEGAVASATAEGEKDEAALVTALVEDCGECTNCLDKRKFGGPGLKRQKCKAPVPVGTRAAAAAAAAVEAAHDGALEARACAAVKERKPSFLGEPKRGHSLLGEPNRGPSLLGEPKREPSLLGGPKRELKRAPLVAVAEASDALSSAEADDACHDDGAVPSFGVPSMDVCAVSSAEADAAAANRSSRRNPKLVIGAVSITAGTPSPTPADGCGGAEAAVNQKQTRRRPRELACLQDWMPPGKNWMRDA